MKPSSSIFRALAWRRRTPTATAERTMSAAGVRTASEKSRQLSASSPASSRASGGARVRARVEEEIMTVVRRVFIGTGAAQCYYTGAPGYKSGTNSLSMSECLRTMRSMSSKLIYLQNLLRMHMTSSPSLAP